MSRMGVSNDGDLRRVEQGMTSLQAFILHSHYRGACGGCVLQTMEGVVLEGIGEGCWGRPDADGSVVRGTPISICCVGVSCFWRGEEFKKQQLLRA